MSKNSKKRRQSLIQKIKSRLYSLTPKRLQHIEEITKLPDDSLLPSTVSIIKTEEEPKRFVLCFDYLNLDECIFNPVRPAELKAVIKIFRNITNTPYNKIANLKIIRDTIHRNNSGEYEPLFRYLPLDVEAIHEASISRAGRMFFFTAVESFYIVAIKTQHVNLH